MKFVPPIHKRTSGFTLVEVLAALTFMAIVVPVAISALRIANMSGEVAKHKAVAARIADRVLNETVVMLPSGSFSQKGVVTESGRPFRWTIQRKNWLEGGANNALTMQLLTVAVVFSAQGRDYDVRLSTLVNGP